LYLKNSADDTLALRGGGGATRGAGTRGRALRWARDSRRATGWGGQRRRRHGPSRKGGARARPITLPHAPSLTRNSHVAHVVLLLALLGQLLLLQPLLLLGRPAVGGKGREHGCAPAAPATTRPPWTRRPRHSQRVLGVEHALDLCELAGLLGLSHGCLLSLLRAAAVGGPVRSGREGARPAVAAGAPPTAAAAGAVRWVSS
jgi:hypothetical protein